MLPFILQWPGKRVINRTPLVAALLGDIWGAPGSSCGFADCSSVSQADRSPQVLVAFPAGGRAEDKEVS